MILEKVMDTTNNILRIRFSSEKRSIYVKKVLMYLHYTDPVYYYIYFGYGFSNVDIYKYAETYPAIYEDKGFIRLKDEDINNYQLIEDFLYEYHDAQLYITCYPDLEKKYDYKMMRDNNFIFDGYTILELEEDYLILDKEDSLPAWDFEKMGITEDMIY